MTDWCGRIFFDTFTYSAHDFSRTSLCFEFENEPVDYNLLTKFTTVLRGVLRRPNKYDIYEEFSENFLQFRSKFLQFRRIVRFFIVPWFNLN